MYAVIYDVDLDALAGKGSLIWEEERPKATTHHEAQTGFMLLMASMLSKSMGYQNSTLSIAVYGCIDTCSRKMLRAKVWVYLFKASLGSCRLEKGSETRVMGFNALLCPTASWGRGLSGDSHVWAINFQSSMCTFLCDAVFFLHQSTWILTLNVAEMSYPVSW